VLGPLAWLVALISAAWLFDHANAIEVGLLIAGASFLGALVMLAAFHTGRRRREARYEHHR
jgi:hypothetical protein